MSSIQDGLPARAISVPEDVEETFSFLYEQGMTDGLPVIPPTPERVARMMAGMPSTRAVAELPPRGGVSTIEKLAINAVMAGCRPEYFPVVVAAVEAMLQPQFNLGGVQTTTNPVAPFLLLNGPMRRSLDVNCGAGALGPGRRANATIGRALRLILINVGGAIPGDVDKSILGMPGKYTFCLGFERTMIPRSEMPAEPAAAGHDRPPADRERESLHLPAGRRHRGHRRGRSRAQSRRFSRELRQRSRDAQDRRQRMLTILDPVGVPRKVSGTGVLVAPALAGRTVGILTNRWQSMDRMAERMAAQLKEVHAAAAVPVYAIPINGAMSDEVRQKVIGECDAAIVGLAN